MAKKTKGKSSAASKANKSDCEFEMVTKPKGKRSRPNNDDKPVVSRKMPKRATIASDYKETSLCQTDKSSLIKKRKKVEIEDEATAVNLTARQDDSQANRRLTDFVFHDIYGNPRSIEMLEVNDLFISGLILPLEGSFEKEKVTGAKCKSFGRVESWSISGYDEGLPIIWVSTKIADYCCVKPANNYKNLYNLFFEKAHASVQVYKALSRTCGGKPDLTIDELIARVVRSMSDSKKFPPGMSIKDFIISQGEFIYNQLIGLDKTSKENDILFKDLPILSILRDENKKHGKNVVLKDSISSSVVNTSLTICEGEQINTFILSAIVSNDVDMKLAKLLQEEENWQSIKLKKTQHSVGLSNKFYIKINEDEIASDYPLPSYYKPTVEETDEYIVFDNDVNMLNVDDIPQSVLQNWSLYNSDSRFISLELLPMQPCADIDVTIFGSGFMTTDEGTEYCHDIDVDQSTFVGVQDMNGIPIYLSAIKEWVIEFGSSMIFISVRTDMAWYASLLIRPRTLEITLQFLFPFFLFLFLSASL